MKHLRKLLEESASTQGKDTVNKLAHRAKLFNSSRTNLPSGTPAELAAYPVPKIATVLVAPLANRLAEYQKIKHTREKMFFLKLNHDVFQAVLNDPSQNGWLLENKKALQAIAIYSPEHYQAVVKSKVLSSDSELKKMVEGWESKVASYNPIQIRIK